ncbi:hypothetical protein NX868_21835 [Burkholderia thailandensis]|uniref:Uncharacterized protein n=1 Tax=Burkholderia thailandensis TaxID=57975 RepID=A0AAW9CL56_BURTH|nr:hypothetical protein [Burkholderia thailandensis]AVR07917.1 hypothetical protein A8H31_10990 [Burkholderia thailandensis]AVR27565.1 hypothetical protein A8H32_21245 [Burkholderia thailandensis]MCS6455315.1 hypothetical protein [Burkholderia thailandensis]MCS6475631.1 hypothetical protein [Burkholderia thailandensis]MCS6484905.1 hypothetical protein [Burkholderia thailandensis]
MRITVSRHGGLFSEMIYLFIFPDLRSGYLFISRRLAIDRITGKSPLKFFRIRVNKSRHRYGPLAVPGRGESASEAARGAISFAPQQSPPS